MTETAPEVHESAEAALELVRVFAQHDHSVEAMKATINADPLTVATAIGFLTSRAICTFGCPGCGRLMEVEHAPGGEPSWRTPEDDAKPDLEDVKRDAHALVEALSRDDTEGAGAVLANCDVGAVAWDLAHQLAHAAHSYADHRGIPAAEALAWWRTIQAPYEQDPPQQAD